MKYSISAPIRKLSQVGLIVILLAIATLAQQKITLNVDAAEAPRNIIHIKETLPVRPGKYTLFYPKWIPGEHSPTGTLNNMVNLYITAGGKTLPWQRDDVEMFAIHCDIPPGVTSIDVTFDDVEGPGTVGSANLTRIKWNRMLMYPRGLPADRITVTSSLQFPAGWQFATALPVTRQTADTVQFGPVDLEHFVDSRRSSEDI